MHSIRSCNGLADPNYLVVGFVMGTSNIDIYVEAAEMIAAQFNSLSWNRCTTAVLVYC